MSSAGLRWHNAFNPSTRASEAGATQRKLVLKNGKKKQYA